MAESLPLNPMVGLDGNWKATTPGVTHELKQSPLNYDCLHHGTPETGCTNYAVPDPTVKGTV